MKRSFAIALFVALSGMAIHAHHSISAVYDDSQRMTIEGVVAQFQFVNPHPLVIVDVTDRDGIRTQWRLEMDNRVELAAIGFTNQSLQPGDRLRVTGSQARRQAHSLYVRRLDRPRDGFCYEQVASSPRICGPANKGI